MAKTSKIVKNDKRKLIVAKHADARRALKKTIANPKTSDDDRVAVQDLAELGVQAHRVQRTPIVGALGLLLGERAASGEIRYDALVGDWVAVERDITERRRQQEDILNLNSALQERVQLRTSQMKVANRELEAFSYSVSHDLRTPLADIQAMAEAIEETIARWVTG